MTYNNNYGHIWKQNREACFEIAPFPSLSVRKLTEDWRDIRGPYIYIYALDETFIYKFEEQEEEEEEEEELKPEPEMNFLFSHWPPSRVLNNANVFEDTRVSSLIIYFFFQFLNDQSNSSDHRNFDYYCLRNLLMNSRSKLNFFEWIINCGHKFQTLKNSRSLSLDNVHFITYYFLLMVINAVEI